MEADVSEGGGVANRGVDWRRSEYGHFEIVRSGNLHLINEENENLATRIRAERVTLRSGI